MNKFVDSIESLKKRSMTKEAKPLLPDLDNSGDAVEVNGKEHQFRLPYSSDPELLEEPWK